MAQLLLHGNRPEARHGLDGPPLGVGAGASTSQLGGVQPLEMIVDTLLQFFVTVKMPFGTIRNPAKSMGERGFEADTDTRMGAPTRIAG